MGFSGHRISFRDQFRQGNGRVVSRLPVQIRELIGHKDRFRWVGQSGFTVKPMRLTRFYVRRSKVRFGHVMRQGSPAEKFGLRSLNQ